MRAVCAAFSHGKIDNLPLATRALIAQPFRGELAAIASTFVDLYDARQSADYDTLATPLSKTEVMTKIEEVDRSFDWLDAIRNDANSNVFFAALLFNRHWSR
jgi:hypothetical protein